MFLQTHFVFDARGLSSYTALGRLVNDPKNSSFCEALKQQSNWSETQIAKELERRGALYPPAKREDLERRLLLAAVLSDVAMVPSLVLTSVRFVVPRLGQPGDPGPQDMGCVRWEALYQPAGGEDTFGYYTDVEPFNGRLTVVSRTRHAQR